MDGPNEDDERSNVRANVRDSKNFVIGGRDPSATFVEGDFIEVGDISNVQGLAIGQNAQARVIGSNIRGDARIDSEELRAALEDLHSALASAEIPPRGKIATQTAVGNALEGVDDDRVNADTVSSNLKKAGEVLKEANTTVEAGTSLWRSLETLASLIGPVVGGARVVGQWFGVAF